jgi:tripartite ATP-independent transporter DctM subunit
MILSTQMIGVLGMLTLLVLIFARVPVAIATGLVGFVGYAAIDGWDKASSVMGATPFEIASAYSLSMVPLFILMGELASASGMSGRLFHAATSLFGGTRGALAYATIGASAAFGAVCGSSVATAATMTKICVPEMQKNGYDDRISTGVVAAGGTIGILIPPSLIFVIYAAITQQSVAELFAAGMLPGLILTISYLLVVAILLAFKPAWAPKSTVKSWSKRALDLLGAWEFVVIFGIAVGGIYIGWFSPTEAAAVGAFMAMLFGLLQKNLDFQKVWSCCIATMRTSCMIFMIVIGAMLFSYFVVQGQLPGMLIAWVQKMQLSATSLILILFVTYIVLGCFLEGIGLVLITVPVFLPVVVQAGFSPIWFGVIVVIVVELGLIHPPVGMNLFVIQAQAPTVSILSIYKGTLPFLIAPILLLLLLLFFPQVALYLPSHLYGMK